MMMRWIGGAPGAVMLESLRAVMVKRAMQVTSVIDFVDEIGKVDGDIIECLVGHRVVPSFDRRQSDR